MPGIVVEVKGLRNYLVKVVTNSGEMLWRRHADQLKSRYNECLSADQHDIVVSDLIDNVRT